jgi:endonuclease/exonuclease/phosphatase family metal-dependent hydrolase
MTNRINILIICLLLCAATFGFNSVLVAQEDETIRVMSFNIRLDTRDDGINQWGNRKDDLCAEVLKQNPHVLGVQEAMNNQMVDLRRCMRGYKSIGVARDDGKKQGEFSALFYKKKSLKPVRSGTFWLSETPEVPGSRGWDAACNRVVTWAEFKDRKTGDKFLVFNTHFDHLGDTARIESAQLIIRKVAELANDLPVVLMGDFNITAKHRAYRILTFPENEVVLIDSRLKALHKTGPEHTWVTFDPDFEASDIIDFIFTSLNVQVVNHKIVDFRESGKHLSDHLPVLTEIKLNNVKTE